MSQPDLIARLHETRPVAPPELRERVRLIAVDATVPPRRRITWRRAVVVLVPIAAAIAAAVVLLPSGGKQAAPHIVSGTPGGFDLPVRSSPDKVTNSLAAGPFSSSAQPALHAALPPAASATRLQNYSASLDLELPTPTAVSNAARQAVAIAASLSGYQQSVTLHTASKSGYALIVLRIPIGNVREAIRRLSALGTITGEDVAIQDLTTQVNAADKRISRLETQLAALETQPQTTAIERRITALTAQIQRLQRTRAATLRTAHYSTVQVQMTTPAPKAPVHHKPGPLHGLGIAFHWVWIGAVYALALGTPLALLVAAIWLLARAVRRRREDSLLAR